MKLDDKNSSCLNIFLQGLDQDGTVANPFTKEMVNGTIQ